jgi:hypothetical protein
MAQWAPRKTTSRRQPGALRRTDPPSVNESVMFGMDWPGMSGVAGTIYLLWDGPVPWYFVHDLR